MTSQPEVPGAGAVILTYDDLADDNLKMHRVYMRVKVLTEQGKEEADVELPYMGQTNIEQIEGRTVQPDGTEVPFTGKPYTKTLYRRRETRVDAKVFTMPAVQVGSILEYRYTWRYDDEMVTSPEWMVQRDLFTREGHFKWIPFDTRGKGRYLVDATGNVADRLAWAQILPAGAEIKRIEPPNLPASYELTVHNIAPMPREEMAPPMSSIAMRVAFYYTGVRSEDQYWREAGKLWTKRENAFIGPNKGLKEEVVKITSPSDTPEQKLRKIYADVMTLDNTDYGRSHDETDGRDPKNTDDILIQKRGSSNQIAELFVGMARAAGLNAQVVRVANRQRELFWKQDLEMRQLPDLVAVVTVDGTDRFFDPGQRYCPFGQMSWQHTVTEGLRQSNDGAAFVQIPGASFTSSQTQRTGDLKLDPDGTVSGNVKIVYMGAPALHWRTQLLLSDEAGLREQLRDAAAEMLPRTMKLTLTALSNTTDYEKPLIAVYRVEGSVGTAMSKRMVLPAQIFGAQQAPMFSEENRHVPIDMQYASSTLDAVRVTLPAGMHWEAAPKPQEFFLRKQALYRASFEQKGNALTMRRALDFGDVLLLADEYKEVHEFFGKVAAADADQSLVSLTPASSAQGAGSDTNPGFAPQGSGNALKGQTSATVKAGSGE